MRRAITTALARLSPVTILGIATVSLTAIFALFALMLYLNRLDVRAAAWTASQNLVAALSRDLQREIERLDMSLVGAANGASMPEVLKLPEAMRQLVLFDNAASAPGLGPLLVLDTSGRLTEEAGVDAPKPIDLSGQAFFQIHRRERDAGLFVSDPFVSLVDGETSIALSRRIDRDGVFAGVVVGTIKVAHIQELFAKLDLGPSGSMSLIADDGAVVLRQPFVQLTTARSQAYSAIAGRIGSARQGNFEALSIADNVPRQYFFNRIGNYPLVQFVGRSLDDVYRDWRHRAALTALAMFLLGNTMLLLVLLLHFELRRRRAAEAELAILAATDGLTGLANRRSFDAVLDREWARALQDGTSIALLLIDIDHFKALNDAIGHQAGDAVLGSVGACLKQLVKGPRDLAARYGGEEFVVVLPGATLADARPMAEALRQSLAALAEPHPGSPTGVLTASIGVAAAVPRDSVQAVALLRAADRAMYQAKRSGRNTVVANRALAA